LENVVAVLVRLGQNREGDTELRSALCSLFQPDHEPSAGSLPRRHRHRPAVGVQRRSRLEELLVLARPLDHEGALQAVRAADVPDGDGFVLPSRVDPGIPAPHSTISSVTRRPPCAPPARTSVLSARAILPPRPITRPRSSGATRSRITSVPSSSTSSTLTW